MNRDERREKVAELEHKQWMTWAETLMITENISQERIDRWNDCMRPYKNLPEEMKDHDRKWADKVLALFTEAKFPDDLVPGWEIQWCNYLDKQCIEDYCGACKNWSDCGQLRMRPATQGEVNTGKARWVG